MVADRPRADLRGREQRGEVVAVPQVQPEASILGFQVGDRFVFEELGHDGISERP